MMGCILVTALGCGGDDSATGSGPGTQPTQVLALDSFLSDLHLDSDHLYFEAQSGIQTLPLAGGQPQELVHNTGEAIAVDADAVWIARGTRGTGQIIRVSKLDGAQQVVADNQLAPASIAVDDTHVFWTNRSTYQVSPPDGSVVSARKDGTELMVLVPGLDEPRNITVDTTFVYFTMGIENATVARVNRDGTGLTPLATGRLWPRNIVVATDAIYWFEDWAGSSQRSNTSPIFKLDQSASQPLLLFEDEVRPHALALDGDFLYWTAQDFGDCNTNPDYVDGVVRRMPTNGGQPETLAQRLRDANDIVIASTAIYWAQSLAACGAIYSLPKR